MVIFSHHEIFTLDPEFYGIDFGGEPDYWEPYQYELDQRIDFEDVAIPRLRGVSLSKVGRRWNLAQKTRRGRIRFASDTTFWAPGEGKCFTSKYFGAGGRKPRYKK